MTRTDGTEDPLPSRVRDVAEGCALLLLLVVLVRCAWQGDDAYITFRTVSNWFHGYGLRWNVVERVQAYTHPLWMLASAACFAVTGELYYSMTLLSIGLTLGAVFVMARMPSSKIHTSGILAIVLFTASSAAIDFSVSGLETPLLVLLLMLFVRAVRSEEGRGTDAPEARNRRTLTLAFLTSLVGLTRLDALLLVAPALVVDCWGRPTRATLGRLLLGAMPLVVWHAFSLAYYGFLFPNTAYAKLNLHVPLMEVLVHGEVYLWDSLRHDPLTLLVTIAGIDAALSRGDKRDRALGWGVALYLVYVVRIGGDFMSGRFFVAPFVVAIPLLGLRPMWQGGRTSLAAAAAVLAGALLMPGSRIRSDASYGGAGEPEVNVRGSGIADERGYYYPSTGLLNVWRHRDDLRAEGLPVPPYRGAIAGGEIAARGIKVQPVKEVGFFGYFAGPDVYVLDRFALADPLLARLPFEPTDGWRVGHYGRRIPAGYAESVLGDNGIVDPGVHAYDDVLRLITRGPLWSGPRWVAILRLQLGLGPKTPPPGYL